MSDLITCPVCVKGVFWRHGQPDVCPLCDAKGRVSPADLDAKANAMLDELKLVIVELPAGDPVVAMERFHEVAANAPDGDDLTRELLAMSGIRQGTKWSRRLRSEGGEPTAEERALDAILQGELDLKERLGSGLYRLYKSGRISLASAQETRSKE